MLGPESIIWGAWVIAALGGLWALGVSLVVRYHLNRYALSEEVVARAQRLYYRALMTCASGAALALIAYTASAL